MGSTFLARIACASMAVLMLSLGVLPSAAGDGMPAYEIVDLNDPEHPDLFTSTFESRQLARVDLLNSTHQRIRLFLSVYSLDPGRNLTVMVPLRTLPVDVTGEPMKESQFRDRYLLDRVETEVVEQDPDQAWAKLWEETSTALQTAFGSMLLTLPGEYSRQTFRLSQSDGRHEDSGLGGAKDVISEPEPVQHYEFDGFSIDVFGVDAAGVLDDYLVDRGLALPETDALDRYRGQYVAVIEAASKPPIDPELFQVAITYAPNATANLTMALQEDPKRDEYERSRLERRLDRDWEQETDRLENVPYWDLDDAFSQLVDAVFGSTDFEGEVLTVDLPLEEGSVFFPLGTSAGWPNQVGDIDILFRVPEDRDLDIDGAEDAYLGGHHYYLFQMELANPGFDLESRVTAGDEDRRAEASRADWTYGNSETLGALFALAVLLVLWFGLAAMLRRSYGIEGQTVRDPVLWAMLGLAFLVSIPGALLVYLMARPLRGGEVTGRLATITPLAMYPAAAIMLVLAVVL